MAQALHCEAWRKRALASNVLNFRIPDNLLEYACVINYWPATLLQHLVLQQCCTYFYKVLQLVEVLTRLNQGSLLGARFW